MPPFPDTTTQGSMWDLKAASISFVIQVAQRVARGKREKPTDKTDTADLLLVELNSAR